MTDRNDSSVLAERSHGDHPTGTRDRDGGGRESSTWAEARAYLELFHREKGNPHRLADRLEVVRREIDRTGTYWQTTDELAHGARVAWRNSNRCIGRLPVFHRGYKNTILKPNFFYQEDPWVERMPNRGPADVPDGIARPHGPR